MIIGITGTMASGKGTISKYLEEKYSFKHLSVRNYLVKRLKKQKKEINRNNMVQLANKLRSQYGSDYIVKELYKEALNYPNTIIESIRTVGEVLSLRDKPDFFLLATDAPLEVRYERSLKRNSVTDNISFEKFIEEENREMDCNDVNKQNLRKCINLADTVIENNGSIKDLEEKIDNLLKFNLKYTREYILK